MARRKRQFLEDDLDSSEGSNAGSDGEGDEGELQTVFRKRKRGKGEVIYGVFGEESEEEDTGKRRKRQDITRAPQFVSGEKLDLDKTIEVEEDEGEGKGDGDDESMTEEDSSEPMSDDEQEKPPSRARGEESPEPVARGLGLGMPRTGVATLNFASSSSSMVNDDFQKVNERTGISSNSSEEPFFPSSFGKAKEQARAFVREAKPAPFKPAPAVQLTASDRAAFASYRGSIGQRLMAKMGYQEGTGLGLHGEGIVTPVESKTRPKNAGIAFRGFEEKTEQSKAEAKRKARREGKVSDDEEQVIITRDGTRKKRSDAWRKKSKPKTRIEHKTYEEIIEESGVAPQAQLPERIIDATGAEIREVSSLADIATASWTPSSDPTRIPEVRHNLRLLCESCKTDLSGLAQEAKTIVERRKWIEQEDTKLRKKALEEANLIARLQKVHLVVDDIEQKARTSAAVYGASLDVFSELFETLVTQYSPEFERYRLDEIIVAAMAPLVKQTMMNWDPLTNPEILTQQLRRWRTALKFKTPNPMPQNQLDVYGDRFGLEACPVNQPSTPMTPYESLIWNVWMPKVRSAINNDWEVEDSSPAIRLFETWTDLLPAFVRDNFLDQLIVPKLQRGISQWHPQRSSMALQSIVFPWLPHLGPRVEEVLDEARRKVKSMFRSWKPSDGLPEEILAWKEVFDKSEWESFLLKYVVLKLGVTLREDFSVNPAQQDMEPFKAVMLWHNRIRASVFSQILETEFFPQWLDILYQWLRQPQARFDEVADWYSFWKDQFPEPVQQMAGIQKGFMYGQQMMNDAATLGSRAATELTRPDYHSLLKKGPPSFARKTSSVSQANPKSRPGSSRLQQEITFKSLVEDRAAKHNLFFVSTGRAHEQSRMPLYRVSTRVDGKGGIEVFILDDAVWLVEGGEYRAIGLDDMILRSIKR